MYWDYLFIFEFDKTKGHSIRRFETEINTGVQLVEIVNCIAKENNTNSIVLISYKLIGKSYK